MGTAGGEVTAENEGSDDGCDSRGLGGAAATKLVRGSLQPGGDRQRPPRGRAATAFDERVGKLGTGVTGDQVRGCVEGGLAAEITGRDRQQDRSATVGRQRHTSEDEQELEAQDRACPCQPHRHRAGCGPGSSCKCGQTEVVGFVVEEEPPVGFVESVQRLSKRVGLLAFKCQLFRASQCGVVDDPVCVSFGDVLAAPVGCEGVACGHDRVGAKCCRLELVLGPSNPDHCFLGDVFDEMRVGCA